MRDERAAPFFGYLVRHMDRRAVPAALSRRRSKRSARFGGADAIEALKMRAASRRDWLGAVARPGGSGRRRRRRRSAQNRHAGGARRAARRASTHGGRAACAPPPAAELARSRLSERCSALTLAHAGSPSTTSCCGGSRPASRAAQLYAADHPLLGRNVDGLLAALKTPAPAASRRSPIGIVDNELVVADTPMPKASGGMTD